MSKTWMSGKLEEQLEEQLDTKAIQSGGFSLHVPHPSLTTFLKKLYLRKIVTE